MKSSKKILEQFDLKKGDAVNSGGKDGKIIGAFMDDNGQAKIGIKTEQGNNWLTFNKVSFRGKSLQEILDDKSVFAQNMMLAPLGLKIGDEVVSLAGGKGGKIIGCSDAGDWITIGVFPPDAPDNRRAWAGWFPHYSMCKKDDPDYLKKKRAYSERLRASEEKYRRQGKSPKFLL